MFHSSAHAESGRQLNNLNLSQSTQPRAETCCEIRPHCRPYQIYATTLTDKCLISDINSMLHPDFLLSMLPLFLDGEHSLVPGFDELAVVIPEIPAHFERGQRGEQGAPVEAVFSAPLPPLRGPSRYDVHSPGGSRNSSNLQSCRQTIQRPRKRVRTCGCTCGWEKFLPALA